VVAAEAARHAGAGAELRTATATGGPSRCLLGSVPNNVSHHGPIAVLIVHTV
jgi:nucleotide-binding universal stress UspA family protein